MENGLAYLGNDEILNLRTSIKYKKANDLIIFDSGQIQCQMS